MIRGTDVVFKIIGIPFLILGAFFLVLGGVFGIVQANGINLTPDDATAMWTLLITFGGLGLLFAVLGLVFFLIYRGKAAKAKRLKEEGVCYDAEISDVKPSPYMGYGRFGMYGGASVVVECWYKNQEGRTCLVRSGGLMLNPLLFGAGKESLRAKVYVSRDDPRDYYVEVTSGTQADVRVDNDYR